MLYDFYAAIVAAAGFIYSFVSRMIQDRLTDKKGMKAHQDEMKRLSKEHEEASKRKDKKKMEEVMQKQMEMLPKMNALMMNSFKAVIPVIAMLLIFSFMLNITDPSLKDDVTFELKDNGVGCDLKAGDGIYSGCHIIQGNAGTWAATVKAYHSVFSLYDDAGAENHALFTVDSKDIDRNAYFKNPKGTINVTLGKEYYLSKEEITVYAAYATEAKRVEATLNSGTSFYVDLPFPIPILNVKRIHEPYWWFIFVAFIFGPVIAYVLGKMEKKNAPAAQAGIQKGKDK